MSHSGLGNGMRFSRGFTLVELVTVIVILGILSIYVVAQNLDSAEMTLPSQAERLASDIRLAQSLAFTSGSRMQLSGSGSAYSVVCASSGCNTSHDFPVTLKKGITLQGSPSVVFKTNGEPVAPASFVLELAGSTSKKTVSIAPITGLVTVTP